jgi:uracil phosphoribosyltransferase
MPCSNWSRTRVWATSAFSATRSRRCPSQYYSKLPPNLSQSQVLIIDPMLATGGSAVQAIDLLKEAGARQIKMICIVAAPEGIESVERHHPDVDIFTPVIDRGLNERKFILPGLGDFGDRLYGTL